MMNEFILILDLYNPINLIIPANFSIRTFLNPHISRFLIPIYTHIYIYIYAIFKFTSTYTCTCILLCTRVCTRIFIHCISGVFRILFREGGGGMELWANDFTLKFILNIKQWTVVLFA